MFLVEDDLPPSTQLDVLPTVGPASTSSLVQTEQMLLPEVALPVSQIRLKTAYDLLRLLRQFSCSHLGVLGTTTASVQLPPVGSSPHVYQVPPPSSSWPVPRLPESALSVDGISKGDAEEYTRNVYIYHLINAAWSLAKSEFGESNVPHYVTDITKRYSRSSEMIRRFRPRHDPAGAKRSLTSPHVPEDSLEDGWPDPWL